MRNKTPMIVALLLGLSAAACRWDGPTTPSPPLGRQAGANLRLQPLEGEPSPTCGHVQWDTNEIWVGPPLWQLPPALPSGALVRIDFESPSDSFQPLLFDPARVATDRLPMVPVTPLPHSDYEDQIDLLQEFLWGYSGSRVWNWEVAQLRVALPVDRDGVAYAAACVSAMQAWNEALGVTRLVVDPENWEVLCEVSEEPRLAYTEILEASDDDLPQSMRVHVSPRYSPGSETYVRRVFLHEFGHVLGLWNHSRDRAHVMNGVAVTTDTLHTDEVRAARWLWSLPNRLDLVALGGRRWPAAKATPRTTATECETALNHRTSAAADSTTRGPE